MTEIFAPTQPKPNGTAKPPPRLRPIAWSAIQTLPKRKPLIRGLLDRGAMSVLYGGSNTGKTFFGLDIAAHVALGWDEWRGLKVLRGGTVYVAAEGGLGIEERLTAFRDHHDVETDGVPFFVIPEPIDLCGSPSDARLLVTRIAELPKDPQIELIVIDTLSRAMAGGNENSPDDMGAFIRNCDTLRIQTGAHVMIIHHAGKDEGRGARGHNSLKAACDTEIEVTRGDATNVSTAAIVKQRDHAIGATFGFTLEQVEIGQHEDGERITSCVVAPIDSPPPTAKKSRGRPLPKAAQIALRALTDALLEFGKPAPPSNRIPPAVRVVSKDQWRKHAYRIGISTGEERAKQVAFNRAAEALVAAQRIALDGDLVWTTG